ncbi:MAG: class I SAM-dependent methyltransferase [Candidatus Aminicenantes bacterium]|nr:class I SAM-dependent methyltransferase [Candidatus Aminicenantes bacterium]
MPRKKPVRGIFGYITAIMASSLLLVLWPQIGNAQGQTSLDKSASYYKKNYTFTADWFYTRIETWNKILAPFKNRADVAYLEIGVFEGRSLLWMLENVLTHPSARATGIDKFSGALEKRFRDNLDLSGAASKVKVIKGYSNVELRKLSINSFDIIYIDGSHLGKDVFVDAALSWSLLKKSGVLIFDDYGWTVAPLPEDRPKMAIDAFLALFKKEIQVLEKGYQVIVTKQR